MKMHRNHTMTLLVALLVTGVTITVAGEPVSLQPADLWTSVSSSGNVESLAPGMTKVAWNSLKRGDSLVPLSLVRTDVRGRTTLTRRGDIIIVSPDTEIVLPEGNISADSIRQNSGKALYKVEPGHEGRRFEVVTPWLVAGVKGTQFSVQVEEGFVAVDVVEGHVEVMSLMNSERIDLFEGHMVMMKQDGGFDLFQENRQDTVDARPAPRMVEVRKETRSMAREAVASMQVSNFMNDLKDMLSDSHADHRNNEPMGQQVKMMARKLGVDLEKLKELMEERLDQRVDDKANAVVKPTGTTTHKPASPASGN